MSMFLCQRCDSLRDSDDGCREGANFGLICIVCINEEPDEAEERMFSTEQLALIDKWEAEAREDDAEEA